MFNDIHEGYNAFFNNTNLLSPLADFSLATTNVLRHTAQQHLEIIGQNFLRLSDQLKRLSSVQRPEELIRQQKEIINENLSAAMENSQRLMQIYTENINEFSKIFASLGETAATVTKNAAHTTAKNAEKAERKMRESTNL